MAIRFEMHFLKDDEKIRLDQTLFWADSTDRPGNPTEMYSRKLGMPDKPDFRWDAPKPTLCVMILRAFARRDSKDKPDLKKGRLRGQRPSLASSLHDVLEDRHKKKPPEDNTPEERTWIQRMFAGYGTRKDDPRLWPLFFWCRNVLDVYEVQLQPPWLQAAVEVYLRTTDSTAEVLVPPCNYAQLADTLETNIKHRTVRATVSRPHVGRGGKASDEFRVGASEFVWEHLPGVLGALGRKFPQERFVFTPGYQPQLIPALRDGDLDVALTLVDGVASERIRNLPLFIMPLVLLVPKNSPFQKAEDILNQRRIPQTLIRLSRGEPITENFLSGLRDWGAEWPKVKEEETLTRVETMAAEGHGVGLSVAVPKAPPHPELCALPLPGVFPPVTFGVLWQGRLTPVLKVFLEVSQKVAARLSG